MTYEGEADRNKKLTNWQQQKTNSASRIQTLNSVITVVQEMQFVDFILILASTWTHTHMGYTGI